MRRDRRPSQAAWSGRPRRRRAPPSRSQDPRRVDQSRSTASPNFGSGSSIECPPTNGARPRSARRSPPLEDRAQDLAAEPLQREARRCSALTAASRPSHTRRTARWRPRSPEVDRIVDDRREEVDRLDECEFSRERDDGARHPRRRSRPARARRAADGRSIKQTRAARPAGACIRSRRRVKARSAVRGCSPRRSLLPAAPPSGPHPVRSGGSAEPRPRRLITVSRPPVWCPRSFADRSAPLQPLPILAVSGPAIAGGARVSPTRERRRSAHGCSAAFVMRGRITAAVRVRGEHPGQLVTRRWSFVGRSCNVDACRRLLLRRQRSDGSTAPSSSARSGWDATAERDGSSSASRAGAWSTATARSCPTGSRSGWLAPPPSRASPSRADCRRPTRAASVGRHDLPDRAEL